jgi:hypothetical protein
MNINKNTKKFLIIIGLVVLPVFLLLGYFQWNVVKAGQTADYYENNIYSQDSYYEAPEDYSISTSTISNQQSGWMYYEEDNATTRQMREWARNGYSVNNPTNNSSSLTGRVPDNETVKQMREWARNGYPTGNSRGYSSTGRVPDTETIKQMRRNLQSSAADTSITLASAKLTATTIRDNAPLGYYYVFVAPTSYHAMQGGKVSFTGSHFYPDEVVTVRRDGVYLGTVTANSLGRFTTVNLDIPYSSGTKTFNFVGATSQISFPVQIMVDGGKPWLNLSTYYAGDNAPLTVTGHGFGSGEQVRISFAGLVLGSATATQNGDVTFYTEVPAGLAGDKIVEALGLKTGAVVREKFSQAY